MEWNAKLYDGKHGFVAEYGKSLLEYIPRNTKQKILDLGCGTGTLTDKLRPYCSKIIGIDSSANMIEQAIINYPEIEFMTGDALALPFENEFDLVFSNAVFHWIKEHENLIAGIRKALKSRGRLVCEFGAKGNIAAIEGAFAQAFSEMGHEYQTKFNFTEVETFEGHLCNQGFVIDEICDYDSSRPLKDNEKGLENWMRQFFASELSLLSEAEELEIIKRVENLTRDVLWNGSEWVADYRRLRAVAHRED